MIAIAAILAVVSCGEDRTYQLEEATQHNHWMLDELKDKYLWADSLTEYEPEWKDFFAKPADFLSKVTKKAGMHDEWSYVVVDTIKKDAFQKGRFNHINSYGFDFVLMNDPTGQTTKQYARVTTVYANSPADNAGMMRNDFISHFDGYKLSNSNASKLEKGMAKALTINRIIVGEDQLLWDEPHTARLEESGYIEDDAFPVYSIIRVGDLNVGYLMCSRLVPHPTELENAESDKYVNEMNVILSQMKAVGVNEVVLDFRLCNEGTIEMAQRLASWVVNPSYINNVFAKTEWNKANSNMNKEYKYISASGNLNLERVYAITSEMTRGAAEWIINGLKSTMGEENVIVIGKKTAGQNVMTQEIGHEHHIHLCPAVAHISYGNGERIDSAIEPDIEVDELSFAELFEYGDAHEALFRTALGNILYGGESNEEEPNEEEGSNQQTIE